MIVRTIKSARAKAQADVARTQDDPGLSKRPTTSRYRKDKGMSRTSLLLAAFTLAAGMTGCTHCDTCDDFPAPCNGPNCGFRGGPVGGTIVHTGPPTVAGPSAPVGTAPGAPSSTPETSAPSSALPEPPSTTPPPESTPSAVPNALPSEGASPPAPMTPGESANPNP